MLYIMYFYQVNPPYFLRLKHILKWSPTIQLLAFTIGKVKIYCIEKGWVIRTKKVTSAQISKRPQWLLKFRTINFIYLRNIHTCTVHIYVLLFLENFRNIKIVFFVMFILNVHCCNTFNFDMYFACIIDPMCATAYCILWGFFLFYAT